MKDKKSAEDLNQLLIENFVSLQRAMLEMTSKIGKLSDNVAQLLHLFELSARTFMESQDIQEVEKDKEFLNKLNLLLEQNKTIARGLTLMEEKVRERVYGDKVENSESNMIPSMANPGLKKLPRA